MIKILLSKKLGERDDPSVLVLASQEIAIANSLNGIEYFLYTVLVHPRMEIPSALGFRRQSDNLPKSEGVPRFNNAP